MRPLIFLYYLFQMGSEGMAGRTPIRPKIHQNGLFLRGLDDLRLELVLMNAVDRKIGRKIL